MNCHSIQPQPLHLNQTTHTQNVMDKIPTISAAEFDRSISVTAVKSIAEALRLDDKISEDATDLLGAELERFIRSIGERARQCAEATGRAHFNLFDVLRAIGEVQEDGEAGDLSLQTLSNFAFGEGEEGPWRVPFPEEVPFYPVGCGEDNITFADSDGGASHRKINAATPQQQVPTYFPPFPMGFSQGAKRKSADSSSQLEEYAPVLQEMSKLSDLRKTLLKINGDPEDNEEEEQEVEHNVPKANSFGAKKKKKTAN